MKEKFYLCMSFRRLSLSLRFMALLLVLILQPLLAYAITLPWSCGFEGGSLASCGLSSENRNDTDFTTAEAAHTGSYGYRVTVSPGVNNLTGGFYGYISGTPTQLWTRWYMRYQSGFSWNPMQYHKLIFPHQTGATAIEFMGNNTICVDAPSANTCINSGWRDSQGGSLTGDGQWHCYEVLLDTGNKVFTYWLDGVQKGSITNVNYDGMTLSGLMEFHTNQQSPGGTYYVDWDDIAMSSTGYIGPLGGAATHDPNPPTNLISK